jgi:hypothetical protein
MPLMQKDPELVAQGPVCFGLVASFGSRRAVWEHDHRGTLVAGFQVFKRLCRCPNMGVFVWTCCGATRPTHLLADEATARSVASLLPSRACDEIPDWRRGASPRTVLLLATAQVSAPTMRHKGSPVAFALRAAKRGPQRASEGL